MYIQLTSIAQPNLGYVAKGAGNSERSTVAIPFLEPECCSHDPTCFDALSVFTSGYSTLQRKTQHINSFN